MPGQQDAIEVVAREVGEDWMVAQPDRVAAIREALKSASLWAAEHRHFVLDEAVVQRLQQKNPYKARAFLQALAASASDQMLVMVWRILEGAEVLTLDVQYKDRAMFLMRVRLTVGGKEEDYESKAIEDAALLRHFGIVKIGGQPRLDGFFALRVK